MSFSHPKCKAFSDTALSIAVGALFIGSFLFALFALWKWATA